MKILHTADLHLGRYFAGHSLHDDHDAILAQILKAIADHRPDVLIIAGDIFDRAAPPETAVGQFNGFMRNVVDDGRTAIVLIAGNHDSGERIGAMAMLADGKRTLVRGSLSAREPTLIVTDAAGPVAFSALPFGFEFAARACFDDPEIKAPADVLRAQVASARTRVPDGARWVIAAHAFVDGGAGSDSERPLTRTAGGIETVPADVFDGAHYVALGHLHRAQQVGAPHIRYAGSPLAFGFDEAGQQKSMTLVDLGEDGGVEVALIPFQPLRGVRTLRGRLDELLADGTPPSNDFIQFELTDPHRLIDPMKRLRDRFPNACGLVYAALERKPAEAAGGVPSTEPETPADVVGAFLNAVRQSGPTEAEQAILDGALADVASRAGDGLA
ncbi:MAG: exonuclease SbcCD subunit D C-terminal domain-containing protein [Pseudomonadota bacterium]